MAVMKPSSTNVSSWNPALYYHRRMTRSLIQNVPTRMPAPTGTNAKDRSLCSSNVGFVISIMTKQAEDIAEKSCGVLNLGPDAMLVYNQQRCQKHCLIRSSRAARSLTGLYKSALHCL